MFFHVDGIGSSSALLDRLAQDPRLLGAQAVSALRVNDWFVVHSSLDWLPSATDPDCAAQNSPFTTVTPFSIDGHNSFHYVTYVAALATALISIGDDRMVIVGSVPSDDPIWTIDRPPGTARTIAYTIDERKYWG